MIRRAKVAALGVTGIFLAAASSALSYDPAAFHDRAGLARFVAARVERTAAPPFSFVYGDRSSASFISRWRIDSQAETSGSKTLKTVVYSDTATKLKVTVVYTLYADYPAVEWVVRFKNEGRTDTPILRDILIASLGLERLGEGTAVLHRARGSDAARSDFAPIAEALPAGSEVTFGPRGGRSSDNALPFFNIAGSDRGIMAAIGWTGRWKAVVRGEAGGAIGLAAGMEKTHFRLHPGEEIRSPSMALVFWKSADRIDGHNLFRRFLRDHHSPRPGGAPVVPPISHGVGYGGPAPCSEYTCATEIRVLAMIDRLAQFGLDPDAYWIDAGWFEGVPGQYWWDTVGSLRPDPDRFPRGLKPVGDEARRRDKGFVLWFEPERVFQGTRLDREHPEWLIRLPDRPDRLFDLGNSRARAWLIDEVARLLIESGVTIYRQDININAAPYWQSRDAADRVSISEIRHVEGLYDYWDALLARVPGLMIDNCAGGGRRLDLETVSRSIPLWRTDSEPCEPNGELGHSYGLQLYLPFSGTGNNDPSRYAFRAAMSGGAVVLAWDFDKPAFRTDLARADIAEFRAVRLFLSADFYPLTEYSTSDDTWTAFQWNRPETGDGIILAFRRDAAAASSIRPALRGLEAESDYEVAFEDYGLTLVRKGRELAAGLDIKIAEPRGSLLIKYRRR
jgi:alpha-galactosidase